MRLIDYITRYVEADFSYCPPHETRLIGESLLGFWTDGVNYVPRLEQFLIPELSWTDKGQRVGVSLIKFKGSVVGISLKVCVEAEVQFEWLPNHIEMIRRGLMDEFFLAAVSIGFNPAYYNNDLSSWEEYAKKYSK
jgi:hypothetical protein